LSENIFWTEFLTNKNEAANGNNWIWLLSNVLCSQRNEY
jgi:hypothetical protein